MKTISQILWRNWFGLLIALIAFILLFQQCEDNRALASNNHALQSTNKIYKNKLGTLTTQNASLELTKKELEEKVINQDEKIKVLSKGFKEIKFISKTKTITQIDTIKTIFKEPIPCSFVREGSISKEWYYFKYKIDSTSLKIDTLKIPNEQIIVSGLKSNGIFKPKTLLTEVTNTNPFISNISFQSYIRKDQVKWYDTTLFKMAAGAAIGITIKNQL